MNKTISASSKLLLCLIMSSIVLSAVRLGFGQSANEKIYVNPDKTILYAPPAQVGSTFNVTVRIADYSHVGGWHVKLVYNASLLSTSSANVSYAPDFIFPSGSYVAHAANVDHFNATHDYVMMNATANAAAEYDGSDAGLVSVRFSVLEIPNIGGVFSCLLWLKPTDTGIVNGNNEELYCNLADGSFSVRTLAPGGGTIYVTPVQNEFSVPPTRVGDKFNVTVRIANYTHVAAWQVNLVYDGRFLNASNAVYASDFIFPEGSYVSIPYGVGAYNATHNYALITAATYGAVEYNGTNADKGLATVTFTILKIPDVNESFSCALWLEPIDTWMVTTDIYETMETLDSGSFKLVGPIQAGEYITFEVVGVDTDFTGTVLTVDNVNYTILNLPVVFWWAEDSNHTFAYSSPLVIESSGKQYVWVNATGLSTLQSGFVIASETGSITANYKTEYIYGLPLWVWVLIVVLIVVVVAVGVVYFRRRKS